MPIGVALVAQAGGADDGAGVGFLDEHDQIFGLGRMMAARAKRMVAGRPFHKPTGVSSRTTL